ncbi:fructosamine kinase family protein [Nonlabens sp. SCSIO 43208]|uniref:fructosamine kinase family protein n=1 Tax=Nonlabens sp. SCSIO 43208 TaxID=2793009 RepID=UPI003D6AE11E
MEAASTTLVPLEIRALLPFRIHKASKLSGGDINEVMLIDQGAIQYVLKYNDKIQSPKMLKRENDGLQLLRKSGTIRVPLVIAQGESATYQYLLLEYITPDALNKKDESNLAIQLAALHDCTDELFGLEEDNYIGSLPQYNLQTESGTQFFLHQRLVPQFELAVSNGFELKGIEGLFKKMERLIPSQKPALIHGDLWNGNVIFTSNGQPVLIDPAAHFGHAEMDIAMMKLFGGFSDKFYWMYHEVRTPLPGWEERVPLYQLYYLLVHLNLFGTGYLNQVQQCINKYV